MRDHSHINNLSTDERTARENYGFRSLTGAERNVAQLAGKGLRNLEVANKLFVTVKTVKFHLSNVYRKFHIENRSQLCIIMERNKENFAAIAENEAPGKYRPSDQGTINCPIIAQHGK